MDLSVIIPTVQRDRQVVDAVLSVLPLQDIDYEVLVVDDSGEPIEDINGVRHLPTEFEDRRIRFIQRTKPSTCRPGLVRNEAAFYEARGKYLYFLDDDDRAQPKVLKKMLEELERRPDLGVAIAAVEPWGPKSPLEVAGERLHFLAARETLRRTHSRVTLISRLLFSPPLLVCSSCVIRRNLFLDIGGFDTELPIYEDVDLFVRAIRRHGFLYVDDVLLQRKSGTRSLRYPARNDGQLISSCYQTLYRNYKKLYGRSEYYGLRLLALGLE